MLALVPMPHDGPAARLVASRPTGLQANEQDIAIHSIIDSELCSEILPAPYRRYKRTLTTEHSKESEQALLKQASTSRIQATKRPPFAPCPRGVQGDQGMSMVCDVTPIPHEWALACT